MIIIGNNRVPETPPAVSRLPNANFSACRDEGISFMLIFDVLQLQCHNNEDWIDFVNFGPHWGLFSRFLDCSDFQMSQTTCVIHGVSVGLLNLLVLQINLAWFLKSI